MSGAGGRWHHTTSFCLSLGVMDRHGQGEGREACSPRAQLCNVQTMLCLSDVSLRIDQFIPYKGWKLYLSEGRVKSAKSTISLIFFNIFWMLHLILLLIWLIYIFVSPFL